MANRRWTSNEQLRVGADFGARPSPGDAGVAPARFDKENPPPFSGAPGPKGHGYKPNESGFHEVKIHVKQDMADDFYGDGQASIGAQAAVPGSLMPTDPYSAPTGVGATVPKSLMPVNPLGNTPAPIGTGLPSGLGPTGGGGFQAPVPGNLMPVDPIGKPQKPIGGMGIRDQQRRMAADGGRAFFKKQR